MSTPTRPPLYEVWSLLFFNESALRRPTSELRKLHFQEYSPLTKSYRGSKLKKIGKPVVLFKSNTLMLLAMLSSLVYVGIFGFTIAPKLSFVSYLLSRVLCPSNYFDI